MKTFLKLKSVIGNDYQQEAEINNRTPSKQFTEVPIFNSSLNPALVFHGEDCQFTLWFYRNKQSIEVDLLCFQFRL